MGLSWQQGPLSAGAVGRFLVPESLPHRLLYAELLRRRMRVRAHGSPIAKTSSYCSNLAAIRSHTFRRTTYLRTFWNAPTIRVVITTSASLPGTPFA